MNCHACQGNPNQAPPPPQTNPKNKHTRASRVRKRGSSGRNTACRILYVGCIHVESKSSLARGVYINPNRLGTFSIERYAAWRGGKGRGVARDEVDQLVHWHHGRSRRERWYATCHMEWLYRQYGARQSGRTLTYQDDCSGGRTRVFRAPPLHLLQYQARCHYTESSECMDVRINEVSCSI